MSVNGLNKITERILADANERAEKILSNAKAECKQIETLAQAKVKEMQETAEAQTAQKVKDIFARAKASASMKERNILLGSRSELLEKVFENAKKKLLSMEREEYIELLASLAASSVCEQVNTEEENRRLYGEEEEITPSSYEVILSKKDYEELGKTVLESAKKQLNGKLPKERIDKLVLSDDIAAIEGGLILRYGDIEANCSLEMLFAELQRDMEGEISQILFSKDNA